MADNLSILDSTGTAKTVRTTDTASVHVPHHIVDSVTGSVTVVGTGTFVTQSVVTNAGTFAVQATQSGTWNITNISGTVSLPTGAATESTLSTLNGKVTACNTGAVVLAAGTASIGKLAANSGVDIGDVDVASLPALPSGTNTIGFVGDAATTTGGTTGYSAISTAAVLAAEVKGSAGTVYSIQAFNLNAAARYVRIYNQTGAPGSGDAANIVWRGMVPGNTAAAGFNVPVGGSKGIACGTGIGIRASAAIADNDTTALAANELIFNVQYK